MKLVLVSGGKRDRNLDIPSVSNSKHGSSVNEREARSGFHSITHELSTTFTIGSEAVTV